MHVENIFSVRILVYVPSVKVSHSTDFIADTDSPFRKANDKNFNDNLNLTARLSRFLINIWASRLLK